MAIIIGQGNTEVLLPATSALATGDAHKLVSMNKSFQTIITGTATVIIEASNDPLVETNVAASTWVTLFTDSASAGHIDNGPWKYYRARVSAYTSGSVTVIAGM